MSSPGVIDSTKFVSPTSKGFQSYLDYMNRSEAVRTKAYDWYNVAMDDLKTSNFEAYNQYMSNPEKTSALFSEAHDFLTPEQMEQMVVLFNQAQDNRSLMWQHVVSFDNAWLEKHGRYDPHTHLLDEEAVMNGTRSAMKELIHNEGMEGAVWTAAIHYNTDNIHVHIAMVEPEPTRKKYYPLDKEGNRLYSSQTGEVIWDYKGKLNQKNLERIKSQVASAIADQSEMLSKINDLSRQHVGKRDSLYHALSRDRQLQKAYDEIYQQLPSNRSLWKYNNNALNGVRPLIEEFIDDYIQRYHSDEFKQLNEALDHAVFFYQETYGESRYDDFKENKLNDLKASLGNGLLKDMNEFYKANQTQAKLLVKYPNYPSSFHGRGRSLNHLNAAFEKSYNEQKNLRDYERMKEEIEYENNAEY
ncbi:MobP2 family relaxase [Lactococcus kimchii]|uniref:MobP2 family relaxase n=1 Tax=Lactococcus sp. S-13 TaxID=2507158 RepID=UPI001022A7B5|nr:MobP2 family relaxase [Lactococcus sp. S-13]RZI47880.1 relaxase [Lactococcus sp. S-13]